MTTITVSLDPKSDGYKQLQKDIVEYLDSLETVKYSRQVQPAPPGELDGVDLETVKLIIELGSAVASLIAAILTISTQVSASHDHEGGKPRRTAKKDAEIEVEGIRISLPTSEEGARKFVAAVEVKVEETTGKKPKPQIAPSPRKPSARKLTGSKRQTSSKR